MSMKLSVLCMSLEGNISNLGLIHHYVSPVLSNDKKIFN